MLCQRLFAKLKHFRKMSVYVQKINSLTGHSGWEIQNENYDYHQEVTRSAYADMLHDTERNKKYYEALKVAISKMHSLGKKANVLDIGTGTGLLSMMAVKCGADSVVACEAFKAMSECAQQIIKLNGFEDKITVIPKRSHELTVGENGDMLQRANILVTEVFDTELIGEGALHTFSHAHEFLLEKDCIVIPHSATVYVEVLDSNLAQKWNRLNNITDEEGRIVLNVPDEILTCSGTAAVHDIQLSQFAIDSFSVLVSPKAVLHFDWSGKTSIKLDRQESLRVKIERTGTAMVVFMWWDINMDIDDKIILSCAPRWAHPLVVHSRNNERVSIPWRDHWMQAIYYLPEAVKVTEGEQVNLISCHDDYSLWFSLKPSNVAIESNIFSHICTCNLHISYARTRIGQLNDETRNRKFVAMLKQYVNADSVVLILGHACYAGLLAAKFGAKKVFCVEGNSVSRMLLSSFIDCNNLKNVEVFSDTKDLVNSKNVNNVNLIFSEPYFTSSILPWDNLLLTYTIKEIAHFLPKDVQLLPKCAIIKGIAVNFCDLFKIRAPLVECEGFKMKPFDQLIEKSRTISDDNVEAQPLWEYPGTASSEVVEIAHLDIATVFSQNVQESEGRFTLLENRICNGIALWVEWDFDGTTANSITTGPIRPPRVGENIEWDMHTRQGVCLFPKNKNNFVQYNFKFDVNNGSIAFNFK